MSRSDYVHESPTEGNFSLAQREESIVPSAADVGAGLERRAALADDNAAGLNRLAAEFLDPAVLRITEIRRRGGFTRYTETRERGTENFQSLVWRDSVVIQEMSILVQLYDLPSRNSDEILRGLIPLTSNLVLRSLFHLNGWLCLLL